MIRNANLNDLNEIAKLHIESYETTFTQIRSEITFKLL